MRTLHKLNLIGAVVGICFALCMVGVISVQWSIDHAVHNSFAGIPHLSHLLLLYVHIVYFSGAVSSWYPLHMHSSCNGGDDAQHQDKHSQMASRPQS